MFGMCVRERKTRREKKMAQWMNEIMEALCWIIANENKRKLTNKRKISYKRALCYDDICIIYCVLALSHSDPDPFYVFRSWMYLSVGGYKSSVSYFNEYVKVGYFLLNLYSNPIRVEISAYRTMFDVLLLFNWNCGTWEIRFVKLIVRLFQMINTLFAVLAAAKHESFPINEICNNDTNKMFDCVNIKQTCV